MTGDGDRENTLDEWVERLPETHGARAELRCLHNDLANALEAKRRRGVGIEERDKVIARLRRAFDGDDKGTLEGIVDKLSTAHSARFELWHLEERAAVKSDDEPSVDRMTLGVHGGDKTLEILRQRIVGLERSRRRVQVDLAEARTDVGIEREEAEKAAAHAKAEFDLLAAAHATLGKDRDRLSVQLAGCLMAAEGSKETGPDSLPEYADCLAVRTVHELRAKADRLEAERAGLDDRMVHYRKDRERLQGMFAKAVCDVGETRRDFEALKKLVDSNEGTCSECGKGFGVEPDECLPAPFCMLCVDSMQRSGEKFLDLAIGQTQSWFTITTRSGVVYPNNVSCGSGSVMERAELIRKHWDSMVVEEGNKAVEIVLQHEGEIPQRVLLEEHYARAAEHTEVERGLRAEIDGLHGRIGNLQSKLKHPKYHRDGAGKRARAEIVQLKKDRRALWGKLVAANRAVGDDSKSHHAWEEDLADVIARGVVKNAVAIAVNKFYAESVVPVESATAIIAIYQRLVESLRVHVGMCPSCAGVHFSGRIHELPCVTCSRARDVLAECDLINMVTSTKPPDLVKCSVCSKLIPLARAEDSGMCGSCEMKDDLLRKSDRHKGDS